MSAGKLFQMTSACVWPWLTGLGLDTCGLVNIPALGRKCDGL